MWGREPACVASKVCQLVDPARVFVLLSMRSGEIYLWLKPYLVVKISFDVVTKHCCQVCVLSIRIESTKTTSLEDISTGALEKIKNIYEVKIKPKNYMMYQDIYNCICQNTKKMKIYYPLCQTYSPNCLKIDFQKVDQHAGGKWLIHYTKRRKDNQLQSLKLPCRISKLSNYDAFLSHCRLCVDTVSDCAIRKLLGPGSSEYHMVWLHPDKPTWDMK